MPHSMTGHTHIDLSWSIVSAPETGGGLDSTRMPYKLFATTQGADCSPHILRMTASHRYSGTDGECH